MDWLPFLATDMTLTEIEANDLYTYVQVFFRKAINALFSSYYKWIGIVKSERTELVDHAFECFYLCIIARNLRNTMYY